jgi:hypothetical protein
MRLCQRNTLFLTGISVATFLAARSAHAGITNCTNTTSPCIGGDVTNGGGLGVEGETNNGDAVYGIDNGNAGVGVYGTGATGVVGQANGGTGVNGKDNGSGTGVSAYSVTGNAIYATNDSTATTDVIKAVSASSSHVAVYANNTSTGYGVYGQTTGTGQAVHGENSNSGGWAGYFNGNLKVTGVPHCTGCTTFTSDSDIRLKTNVKPLEGALDQVLKLQGVSFEWKQPEEHGNRTGTQRGFIAQDVEKVFPEWVATGTNGFKTVNLTGLEPILVESIRALKKENEKLEERIKALESNRPVVRAGFDGNMLGFGGAAIGACALVLARRRRSE